MMKQSGSRIFSATVILCLCFGSLVILPVLNVIGLSDVEAFGPDIEHSHLLDPVEFDEEAIVGLMIGATAASLLLSKSSRIHLGFACDYLSRISPPPKYA